MKSVLLFAVSLVSAQEPSVEDGHAVYEGFYPNNIKTEMYTRTWVPIGKPVANLVFVHGQAEHVNRYNRVFSEFAKAGIKVHAFDQVGCGKTGKRANKLGGAMGMERVKLDIDDAIVRIHDGQTPLFLMGHSFGGSTVLDYLARGNRRNLLYGALAASPDLALAPETQPTETQIKQLVDVASRNPQFRIFGKLDPSLLTRNRTEIDLARRDPLIFSRCAAIQVRDTVIGGRYILDGGYTDIRVPRLMIVHGTADKITHYGTSEKLAFTLKAQGTSKRVDFTPYPGGYHELHNDIIRDQVIANHVKWILAQARSYK
ncbi:hypothetical protein DSO57_1000416 [Entomophthora muscae]|uniref:Uncharacterized protein n=1 Tax=Entomophthora muscae TaxID=34485 RepID=A0ACC2UJG5_9FUNG|nr:hypothetical protein DSO57_1000416 [Entomophthora muscae]